ncbi:hypothetical protein BS78_K158500 [Paspalum vaginatum]|uniref:Ycf15 n=1 Tax=Paspalum vaginatum TaxID=158149 RepID=A0A9W8CCR9_9POAL|nr:hypothetical protein BS78_K158500 [Paspalum vaginatum]
MLIVFFRSKDIRGGWFIRPILICRTKRSWILFRIGPKRRREAEMPIDPCLFSNSPDPIVPVFGTSSAKVTEWVSHQSNPFEKSGVIIDIIFYIYGNIIE